MTHMDTPAAHQTVSRILAQITSAGGAVLVAVAGLTTTSCLLLGALVVRARDGWGSWIPLVIACLATVLVVALALDRRRLVRDLREAPRSGGPTVTVDIDGQPDEDPTATTSHLPRVVDADSPTHPGVLTTGSTWREARAEFDLRRPTPLPRVEAAQRAARTWVGASGTSPWLERDLRPSLVLVVATAAIIPVTATTALIAALVLLTS